MKGQPTTEDHQPAPSKTAGVAIGFVNPSGDHASSICPVVARHHVIVDKVTRPVSGYLSLAVDKQACRDQRRMQMDGQQGCHQGKKPRGPCLAKNTNSQSSPSGQTWYLELQRAAHTTWSL